VFGREGPAGKKRVDDKELTRRLKEAAAGKAAEHVLAKTLRFMRMSRDMLRDQFDPGETTQAIQKEIVLSLDETIEQARRNMSSGSSSATTRPSDRRPKGRRGNSKKQAKDGASAKPKPGEGGNPQKNTRAAGKAARAGKLGGDLRETGREWGNLPPRDRQEVVQGLGEDVLLKYREIIEKYYRALAEQANR